MAVTITLPEHLETKLAPQAAERGIALPDFVLDVLENLTPSEPVHPLLQLAEDARAGVPETEWANVPTDLAANLDHYLHGRAKEKL